MLRRFLLPFACHLMLAGFVSAPAVLAARSGSPETSRRAQTIQADPVGDLLRIAWAQAQQKHFEDALANCTKAAALDPKDYRIHVVLATIYLEQNNLNSSSNEYAEAIRLQPTVKKLYLLKANVDIYRNKSDEALAGARKATEIDPNYAEAYALIGKVEGYSEKQRPEAIVALRTAIRLKPQLLEVYEDLGEALENSKDEKGAEEVFRQGMAADPVHMAGRFALGRMMVKQGRLKDARELWDGRTSDKDIVHPQFIEVLTRAEELQRATDALAKSPNDPAALVAMGFAVMEGDFWVSDGRQKRAFVYFRKALDQDPKRARAQYGIVKGYIEIADTFKDANPDIDRELAKLRQMDPKLADEMVEYRKTFVGGISGPTGPSSH